MIAAAIRFRRVTVGLCQVWLSTSLAVLLAAGVWGAESAPQPRDNLALGKRYTLAPAPSYRLCTDPGDAIQLTDGKTTADYFWTQAGTVGWQSVGYATVTVDLERVEPIAGVAVTTAAGVAGVTWPAAVYVLLTAWAAGGWDPLELITVPPKATAAPCEVHTMLGEYRSGAVNLANSTDQPLAVRLRFEGLPQSPQPGYVTVQEVRWTDTAQSVPVAAAVVAEQLLRTAADEVLAADGAAKLSWHEPKDRTAADRARVRILGALDALRK